MTDKLELLPHYGDMRAEIVALLDAARTASARSVNALMTATYWEIGRLIVEFEQAGQERAEYGEALIRRLADDLAPRFGRGFGRRNLTQMRAFFLVWPATKILHTPSAKSPALPEQRSANRACPSTETSSREEIDGMRILTSGRSDPEHTGGQIRGHRRTATTDFHEFEVVG